MTIDQGVDASRIDSRIRVTLLADVLDRAVGWVELRQAILEGASKGAFPLYWPIPPDRIVFSGPGSHSDLEDGKLFGPYDYHPPGAWIPRTNLKFVRIPKSMAEYFLFTRNMIQNPITELDFSDGLLIPNDVDAASGLLEATAFSAPLRLSHRAALDEVSDSRDPWSRPEIRFLDLYIGENTVKTMFPQSQTSPDLSTSEYLAPNVTDLPVIPAISTDTTTVHIPPNATSADSIDDHEVKSTRSKDPYQLKGRSDGVYILYRMAERYEQTFAEATNASERRLIAPKALDQLLEDMATEGDIDIERRKDLRRLFGKTRLESAINLINPKRDHNNGLVTEDRTEVWPTPTGEEFLDRFGKRPEFINKTLALIIGGVGQWCDFDPKSAGEKTKQAALRQWLENHGLTNTSEVEPAYTLISGSRADSSHTTPKSLPPSPSNAPLATKSQKSRRRV